MVWTNYFLLAPTLVAFRRGQRLHTLALIAVAVASIIYHKRSEASDLAMTIDVACAMNLTVVCSHAMVVHRKRQPLALISAVSVIGYGCYGLAWFHHYGLFHSLWHLCIALGQFLVVAGAPLAGDTGGKRRGSLPR